MRIKLTAATVDDAPAIQSLREAVAGALTAKYGEGSWSSCGTFKGVLFGLRNSRVYVARSGGRIIATLSLAKKKPWAIDRKYFTPCQRPIYLTSMAVSPDHQRKGIGGQCLDEARKIVQAWPGDAIFLDAYDATAGAGEFYRKCGFREVGRVTYKTVPLIYFEWLVPTEAEDTN